MTAGGCSCPVQAIAQPANVPTEDSDRIRRRFERRKQRFTARAGALQNRAATVSILRLAFFLAAVLFVWLAAAALFAAVWWTWSAALVSLGAFAFLIVAHARLRAAQSRCQWRIRHIDRELLRIEARWTEAAEGPALASPAGHRCAGDLNLTGDFSLHQAADRSATVGGRRRLAALLLSQPDEIALHPGSWFLRQQAIGELQRAYSFRQRWRSYGAWLGRETDPERLEQTLQTGGILTRGAPRWMQFAAAILSAFTLGAFVLFELGLSEAYFLLSLPVHTALYVILSFYAAPISRSLAAAATDLTQADRLFHLLERYRPKGEHLKGLRIFAEQPAAAIREFARISGLCAYRRNPLLHLIAGFLFFHELHALSRWRRWRDRHAAAAPHWFEDLYELDALQSLAGLNDVDGRLHFPTLLPETERSLWIDARGLAHPLLPAARRVGNDLVLRKESAIWILTGSNMSGKSTLLRSLGCNHVLAMAGAPVAARAYAFRPLEVWTSMRQEDDLSQSVSLFYAEARRLRLLLEAARDKGPGVLLLIDEMLRGTNARERTIASQAVLEQLHQSGAATLLATHDLELAGHFAGREGFRFFHFQESVVGDRMSFDYALREGPVESGNALRILKMEGVLP